jgi:hypothetical protein
MVRPPERRVVTMELSIEWHRALPLVSGRKEGLIYTADLEKLPRTAGVYIFARRWGKGFEALYIGQSTNLRGRTRSHLNNLRLMRHLEEAKTGRRVIFVGEALTKPGQQMEKVLRLLERALIRHYLSEGHDLVNQQGVRIRRHEITSAGRIPRSFVPGLMYLERTRGE